ncbi:MAG: hypothetical protein A2Y12_05965 [Planctomycetes bacterium GWF2_42_9]|nr:MAG: hypothetical protein A2Y12_05965 [Planctomycetes bacterium GWF2_42_9]
MVNSFNTLVISTLIACSFTGCNAAEKKTGIVKSKDPVIARADVVSDATPGLTPIVLLAANRDLIVSWDTGKGDCQPGGTIPFARSSDFGRTWSRPYMTLKSDKPLTGFSASLYKLPDGNWTSGRLLLYVLETVWQEEPNQSKPNWLSLTASRKFDSYYSFSLDDGYTFTERKILSDPVTRNDFAQGNIVELPNGDLIWPWGYWGSEPLNGFKRSTDGGLNWSPAVRAWQDPPPGYKTPLAYNETAAAVCKDGTIVAVARVDGAPDNDKKFWQIKSNDNGKTWTTPRQIEIIGGSPAMYCTPKGQLWLAYRDGGVGPGLGLAVSDDNGETWRFLYHLKDPKGEHKKLYGHIRYTDEDRKKPWRPAEGTVGYPCFAKLSDTEVYVVYHAHNKAEMGKKFPEIPFYIAGNLLRIPE